MVEGRRSGGVVGCRCGVARARVERHGRVHGGSLALWQCSVEILRRKRNRMKTARILAINYANKQIWSKADISVQGE